jgi:hypothetical protein
VGSTRVGQVRFHVFSGDHPGSAIPHLHAHIGSGEVVVEILPNGDVRLSRAHGSPIRGTIGAREQRIVLETARDHSELLIELWKASRPR